MPREKVNRKQQILETLAQMLEHQQGQHITTASLAKAVGFSEAALYRHFRGKAQMFEALIEFIEESLFTRINKILAEEGDTERRMYNITALILGFAHKNPGITRLMQGDVLVGETRALRDRIEQLFNRLLSQFKQVLREGHAKQPLAADPVDAGRLLLALIEGLISDYVRSGFERSPVEGLDELWGLYRRAVFNTPQS
jgi:TetR/AcrR family transcriptional regulator